MFIIKKSIEIEASFFICNFTKKMNVMDLQARKIEFIQEFLKVQSEDVVVRLEKLLKKETSRIEKKGINPFSIDEFHKRIDASMHDSLHNKLTENQDLLAEMHTWH